MDERGVTKPGSCCNHQHERRARDSNPQVLSDASFQDWCNSHSASPPTARSLPGFARRGQPSGVCGFRGAVRHLGTRVARLVPRTSTQGRYSEHVSKPSIVSAVPAARPCPTFQREYHEAQILAGRSPLCDECRSRSAASPAAATPTRSEEDDPGDHVRGSHDPRVPVCR